MVALLDFGDRLPGPAYGDVAEYYGGPGGTLVLATNEDGPDTWEAIEATRGYGPYERFDEVSCGQSKLSHVGAVCFQVLEGGSLMVRAPEAMHPQQVVDILRLVYARFP